MDEPNSWDVDESHHAWPSMLAEKFLCDFARDITNHLLRPGELKRVRAFATAEGEGWIHVEAGEGEHFRFLVNAGGEESETQRSERFKSDMQDWISESRFGWGQLRQ
ncbi:MAG: hypothetical protein U0Q15_20140 [Kineosporiaceae bacterium]